MTPDPQLVGSESASTGFEEWHTDEILALHDWIGDERHEGFDMSKLDAVVAALRLELKRRRRDCKLTNPQKG